MNHLSLKPQTDFEPRIDSLWDVGRGEALLFRHSGAYRQITTDPRAEKVIRRVSCLDAIG
jgi:hypothetical protein